MWKTQWTDECWPGFLGLLTGVWLHELCPSLSTGKLSSMPAEPLSYTNPKPNADGFTQEFSERCT